MKTSKLFTAASFFIIAVLFFSCKKNAQPDPIVTSPQALEFINFNIDGIDTSYAVPADNMIYEGGDSTENQTFNNGLGLVAIHHNGVDSNFITFNFSKYGISAGSSQIMGMMLQTGFHPLSPATVQYVNITEFGVVGGYVAGNFSGPLVDGAGASHPVSVDFRIKRTH